jgi:hypothetical protein
LDVETPATPPVVGGAGDTGVEAVVVPTVVVSAVVVTAGVCVAGADWVLGWVSVGVVVSAGVVVVVSVVGV